MDDIGSIQLEVKVNYKELTGLIKTTEQTKRAVSLLAKDFARTGDKSQYMSSINKIVMAQSNLSKTSRMSQSAIMKLGAKVQQETKYTDSLTAATKRLNAAQMTSNKVMGNTRNKMNSNNMAIQQLGYQFGDFAVQVQSGTSAFVAFSQQGAQLAGILPMIAGPLGLSMGAAIGLSAALGVLIPIGSAVGRMFMEMNTSATEAANKIKSFKENLKSAKAETFEMVEALRLLKSGFETKAELALSDNLIKAQDHLKAMLVAQENINKAQFESDTNRQAALDIAKKDIDQAREKVKLAREDFNLHKKASASLEKEKDKQRRNESIVNQLVEARKIILEQEKEAEEKLNKLKSENLVEFLKLKYKNERLAREKAFKEEKESEERQTKNRIDSIKHFYKEKAKAEAEDLAMAKKVAEIKEKLRQKEFAGMQGRRGARGPSAIEIAEMGMGPQITDAQSKLEAQEELNKKQDEYLATLSLTTQEQLVTAGLKDRELLVAEQFNEKYKVQLELEKLGLEYGSAKYERALETLKTQQESVLHVYDRIEAEKKLTEEKKKQGQLIDTIGGIIGDGFISMVEGTESVKDAFKSMAIAIIKELYQILVVQQMVNAAKAAFGIPVPNANGNVFSSGSIQPYADGGVVGSPTTFPMTGGKTGLMGEAGPEAIMPLKRGANGKLGVQMEGGATTTVVQNFNFSANGDDSVKRIIAQAAPKIAQMTKSEIINDRRRGGTMKATFG
jgi:hypothetical protein